jgi:DNA repair protein RecO (recombination protein O)
MPQPTEVNAINLKSSDSGENDRLLKLFSFEAGVITAKIRGVKKAQAKLKYAQEPFCFGKYYLAQGKGNIYIVTGCEAQELFYDLRSDLGAFTAAAVAAEYCLLLSENTPDTRLFKLLVNTLTALCYKGAPSQNILIYFLINALRQCGALSDFNKCGVCGAGLSNFAAPDAAEGGFLCLSCNIRNVKPLPAAAYKTIKFIGEIAEISRLNTVRVDALNAADALKCLNMFVGQVWGRELKSLQKYCRILFE